MGAGTIKTTKEVLFQLNTQKPRGPAIPFPGSDPEKIRIHSDPCTLFSGQLDWQWPRTRTVAGQNLGFLCPVKPNKKYRDRVWRRYEGGFYSQASREGNTVGSCLKDCVSHPLPMKSLGAYIREWLTVRCQWWGTKWVGSISPPCAIFQRQS